MTARPHPWEWAYPPGLAWYAPLPTGTLGDLLRTAVAAYPDRVAIEFRGAHLTFRTLGDLAARCASGLAALPGAVAGGVALLLPNSPAHPVALFGAALAGARVTHLSPLDAERALAHKLRDGGARTLVTLAEPGPLARAAALRAAGLLDHLIVGDDLRWGPGPPAAPLPEGAVALDTLLATPPGPLPPVSPDAVALLQYTGGTTGVPKGAMLTHRNLTAAASMLRLWNGGRGPIAAPPDRVIAVLPLFHIYALTSVLLRHVAAGNTLLLRPRFDPAATLDDIETGRATVFPGVPTMWIALANQPGLERRDLSSLRVCSSGGAPLPVEVAARFERLTGLSIGGGWGMTETAPAGTSVPIHGPARPGTIGVPLPGIELEVVALDDPRQVLPPGETGELRIRGPNVFQGYWNRPAETAAAFVDGWFLTGDIGRMDPDGLCFLTDRKGDLILSGGFNVYPRVIEEAVYEHPDIAEAIVVGIPDPYRGAAAKVYATLRPGAAPLTLDALRGFLEGRLGRHELPAELELRDTLPRTTVGKLSKLLLLQELAATARG